MSTIKSSTEHLTLNADGSGKDIKFQLNGTEIGTIGAGGLGKVLQVVNVQDGAVATGTTIMPFDDTIPQNTEGVEFMTLAITPSNASNLLKIEINLSCIAHSTGGWFGAALFQDTTAGALASNMKYQGTITGLANMAFTHYMTAGTTSATTFKVRAGTSDAGTITFNGRNGARLHGGSFASSITITEIKA